MKRTSHGLTLPNPKLLMLPLWHFLGKLSTRLRNVRDHTQREPWDRRSWPGSFKDCSVKVWTAADFHDWFERGSAWFSIVCERISCKKIIQPRDVNDSCCTGRFLPLGCIVLRAHRARQSSRTWSNSGLAHSKPHMPQSGAGPG